MIDVREYVFTCVDGSRTFLYHEKMRADVVWEVLAPQNCVSITSRDPYDFYAPIESVKKEE